MEEKELEKKIKGMSIWRIHLQKRAEYCLKNNCAALGWADINGKAEKIEEYIENCNSGKNAISQVSKFFNKDIKEGDVIWTRHAGEYYFARITKKTEGKFVYDKETMNTEIDSCNQLTNIEWKKINQNSDEASVPGCIKNAFIRGRAFQKISTDTHKGALKFSLLIAGTEVEKEFCKKEKMSQEVFFDLISPSDLEDLLCMWLYRTKGYICIPSTNKISTPLYECVLIDPKVPGKHIYIQAKNGDINIDAAEYTHLIDDNSNEVYLVTTKGKVNGDSKNIFEIEPQLLYNFVINQYEILPPNIKLWMDLLNKSNRN